MNAHVFYIKKHSPLSKRILATTKTMPLNHPNFVEEIVEKARFCPQSDCHLPEVGDFGFDVAAHFASMCCACPCGCLHVCT